MVALIGGIEAGGALRRDVRLQPLSGRSEMALAELDEMALSQPEKVSLFLAETVAEIAGETCDAAFAARLCVADRQHLVRQIADTMGKGKVWLSGQCDSCGDDFDVPVEPAALPVKPAAARFPASTLQIGGRNIAVRTPTGADQAAITCLPEADARAVLLRRLADLPASAELTRDEADRIEAAVEALSPEVSLEVSSACPSCAAELRIGVDPYLVLSGGTSDILEEVHQIATSYHWSEADILALPPTRRRAYLRRIDRTRGMVAQAEPHDRFH